MAALAGFKSRILVDDFHLSTVLQQFSPDTNVAMLDATVFTSDAMEYVAGISGSKLTAAGLLNTADSSGQLDLLDEWTTSTAKPVTIGMAGLAVGSPLWMTAATESSFTVTTAAAAVVGFSLEAQTNGRLDQGVSLHDLTAETADEDGAAVDGAALSPSGGIGHLHVTAFSGLTSADITIESSTDGATSWTNEITFAQVTGVTSERVQSATTVLRYTRYTLDVTGTGSISFQVGFARL